MAHRLYAKVLESLAFWEKQMETTERYHSIPTRIRKIKRLMSPNAGKDGGAVYWKVSVLLVGMQNGVAGKLSSW